MDHKDGETMQVFKFDGDETKWLQWSMKTMMLANARGFHLTYTTKMSPCSDIIYATSATAEQKKIYEANDKAFQLLVLSCVNSAFGFICNARTQDLKDGDAFLAWNNLCERYAPQEMTNLVQLSTDYKLCTMENNNPDTWFNKMDTLQNQMTQINPKYEKEDGEVIAHILCKLPSEYSDIDTAVEGMSSMTLRDIKAKIQAFHKHKIVGNKSASELAMFVGGKFKGDCHNCGKQGHKASECCSKSNVAGDKGHKDKKTGIKCFNCNKFAGHYAKDCPEKKKTKVSDKKIETRMFVGKCVQENKLPQGESDTTGMDKVTLCAVNVGEEKWLADTGASSHITMSNRGLTNTENVSICVIVGNGKEVLYTKQGDVHLQGPGGETLLPKKVLYAPTIHKNIVSMGVFVKMGNYKVQIRESKLSLLKDDKSGGQLDFKSEGNDVLYYYEGTIPDSPSGPTPPPNLTFTSSWLRIDLSLPVTEAKHSPNDILLTFHNFTSAAWLIDPFLSFLPIFPTSKYPPLTKSMANSTSVHTLKHYLKNSTIASLLKQDPLNNTFRARLLTHSSIPATSLIHQIRSDQIHPSCLANNSRPI